MNKAIIVGNLGADPDLRYTPSGTPVCEMRVATSSREKGPSGKYEDHTEWHRIVIWGTRAETAAKHLSRGSSVEIDGKLRTRRWEDKEGNVRFTTEIVAFGWEFGPSGGTKKPHANGRQRHRERPAEEPIPHGTDQEDLPF